MEINSRLVMISVPLRARDFLFFDWLSMVLWSNDSKPNTGPQLMGIAIHSQRTFNAMMRVIIKLRTRGYTRKIL